jgi:hypothetical protein
LFPLFLAVYGKLRFSCGIFLADRTSIPISGNNSGYLFISSVFPVLHGRGFFAVVVVSSFFGSLWKIEVFLWNLVLADRTSIPSENASSVCLQDCSNRVEACVRAETDGKGVCVLSTTRYFHLHINTNLLWAVQSLHKHVWLNLGY